MNKLALQLFLVLAFIPIAILISSIIITLAPLYCWGLAINAYRFGNTKELYFWLAMGVVAFFLALICAWSALNVEDFYFIFGPLPAYDWLLHNVQT